MNSESLTATLMLPSNDVINEALEGAHKRLNMWNMERADSILKQWILDVCFFNQQYKAQELNNSDGILKSIFSKEWRNVAQKVDTENCKTLSNGIVYPVEKLYIPNNVLMYRLKEDFCYYENCTDEQKASYYVMTNMAFSKCNTDVAAWSPLPGVWPLHENRVLILKAGEDGTGAACLSGPIIHHLHEIFLGAANMLGKIKTCVQIACVVICILERAIYAALPEAPAVAEYLPASLILSVLMLVFTLWSGINYIASYWKYMDPQK